MRHEKNELLMFLAGIAMLAVGLFIFSQKVIVSSYMFSGFMLGGFRVSGGLVIIPFIMGIVWMFASGGSIGSKVLTGLSVLFIIVSVILSTNIRLSTMTLYDWILILVLIFGGAGLLLRMALPSRSGSDEGGRRQRGASPEDMATQNRLNQLEAELREMKKKNGGE